MNWIWCPAEKVHLSWKELLVINGNELKGNKSNEMFLMKTRGFFFSCSGTIIGDYIEK